MDDEVRTEIKYRLRNPFYASWLISFVLWNWKAVLVIIYPTTELGLFDRLNWIEGNLYPQHGWIRTLVLPVATAIVAVAGLPWFINWLDDFRYRAVVAQKNKRIQRDAKLLPNAAETLRVRADLGKALEQLNKATNDYEGLKKNFTDALGALKLARDQRAAFLNAILTMDPPLRGILQALKIDRQAVDREKASLLMKMGLLEAYDTGAYAIKKEAEEAVKDV